MSSKRPVVGIIFLVGLGIATAGAGYYTFLLPEKTSCPATPQTYTVNATAYQWGFVLNGTDATENGWTICRGSTVTFRVSATFEHNSALNWTFAQHGFFINGVMSSAASIPEGQVVDVTVTFDRQGKFLLFCTIPCSEAGYTGEFRNHEGMSAQITVL